MKTFLILFFLINIYVISAQQNTPAVTVDNCKFERSTPLQRTGKKFSPVSAAQECSTTGWVCTKGDCDFKDCRKRATDSHKNCFGGMTALALNMDALKECEGKCVDPDAIKKNETNWGSFFFGILILGFVVGFFYWLCGGCKPKKKKKKKTAQITQADDGPGEFQIGREKRNFNNKSLLYDF